MKKKIILIVLTILFTGAFISVVLSQKAPLVSDINIVPPDPSLPAEVRSLSGKWSGQWNSNQGWDCVVYVEKVNRDSAQVVHAWGEYTTSRGSCHCGPNWIRIKRARVNYSEGKTTIAYATPPFQSKRLLERESRTFSGSVEEPKGSTGTSRKGGGGRGQYDFSFMVDKNEPNVMKGHFISGKASQLRIEMKKIDQAP